MEGLLSMGSILSEEEAAKLFEEDDTQPEKKETTDPKKDDTPPEGNDNKDQNKETTEINPDDLFVEESESVGSEKEKSGQDENTPPSNKDGGTSPNTTDKKNFYSSIATAFKGDGVFPDLEDSDIEKVQEPEDLINLVNKQVDARLTETQKRVNDALNNGVQPNVIQQFEGMISYLNKITEDQISAEGEEGENLRRKLLQQDFLNNNYSQERAIKLTERLFDNGDDVEEAKNALQSNKDYFNKRYQQVLNEAKQRTEEEKKVQKKQAEDLKKDILESDKAFGSIVLDKASRQKVYDTISRPVWRDPDTGDYYTAIQKYRKEHPNDFIKNVGYLYTLTNGFKDIESLVKPQTKKEVKSKLRELEHTLNNTTRNSDGSLKYSNSEPSGSIFDQGLVLDVR